MQVILARGAERVDKTGDTVDFLLTAKRDKAAAQRYLERAINLHGLPEKITVDKSGENPSAIQRALLVEAGVLDAHDDVTGGQFIVLQWLQRGERLAVLLREVERIEHGSPQTL